MKQFKRSDRLAQQILRDVAVLMASDLADRFRGMVTFTRVKLTDDYRFCKILYSHLGEESERPAVQAYLSSQAGRVKGAIGDGLRVRHVPDVSFAFDPSIEEGVRMEQLFQQIRNEREGRNNPH